MADLADALHPVSTTDTILSVDHVRQAYPKGSGADLLVLDDINLNLKSGEIVGLLGRSGSGKSSLLRIIAGLSIPVAGEVSWRGRPLRGPSAGIAMVFQSFALFPWLTVLENVEIGLEALGVPTAERRRRSIEAIDLIGLDGFESAYPKELSGGMRQRVGFARALVVHPELLLMDEPFSALDVLTAETLRTDLVELWMERKLPLSSILLVTHNIEEAVLMCDRVIIFAANPGRIAAEIRVDLPHPRNRTEDAFRQLVDDIYGRMTNPHGDIRLTESGRRFADSDTDTRKRMFAEPLLANVPIVALIHRVLEERPSHKAPYRRFSEELEDFMSEAFAEETLDAAIAWGRYAELFAYDEQAGVFSLENPV